MFGFKKKIHYKSGILSAPALLTFAFVMTSMSVMVEPAAAQNVAEPYFEIGGGLGMPQPQSHGSCTPGPGDKEIRFFFTYTNGQIDSGTWIGQFNITPSDTSDDCFHFENGDTDLDAAELHLSCSEDYTDATINRAGGGSLTVEQWFIDRLNSNGGSCPGTGRIVITKDTGDFPEHGGVFEFNPSWGGNFNLQTADGGPPTSRSFDLSPGSYHVTEVGIPGVFTLDDISCQLTGVNGSSSAVNLDNARVDFDLNYGDVIECTYINIKKRAFIKITKVTDPHNTGTGFDFEVRNLNGPDPQYDGVDPDQDFSDVTDGATVTTVGLRPYTDYRITEVNIPNGWDLTDIDCNYGPHAKATEPGMAAYSKQQLSIAKTSDSVDINNIQPDQTVTCTFFNEGPELLPGIQIDKTDGGVSVNEGASFAYTLSYENTGQLPLSNVVITETVPSNTTFNAAGSTTGWSCAGVNPGATCTFNVGGLAVGADGSVQFGLTVDEFWEPNPNTGLCPDEPPPVQVNNSADIDGQSSNGNADDNGQDTTPVTMACEDNPATLTVVKVTDPAGSTQSFGFTGSVATDGFGSFNLTGAAPNNQQSFTLPGGNYSVSENVPGGWVRESTSCTGGNTVGNINLNPGESVTCTFTNRKLQGSLTVVKLTKPAGDPQVFNFTGPEGTFDLSHGQSKPFTLAPGTYSVSETVPSAWTLASANCSNGDDPGNVTIADGDDVTCTFTNEKDGEITIVKNATPDDTGETFSFTGDLGAFSLKHGESKTVQKAPGSYSVAETVPSGWDLTSATCSDGSDASAIELAPGESVNCTFFNQRLQANLDVVKKTNGVEIREGICDNGITVGESVNWTYAVSNPGQQPLEIVSVIDDAGTPANIADDFSPAFVGGDTNGDSLLDPSEVWNYAQSGTAAAIQYTNQVTVTAEVQDSTKAPAGTIVEASDVSGYCGEEVDVAIEKTDGGQLLVPEGGTVIYTLSYENLGTVDVTGVVITETVPQNTSFNAAGSTAGWSCADGAAAGTTCTFNVGPLPAGTSGSVLFALEVDDLVQPDPDTGQCPADPPEFLVDNTGTIADDGANGADADPSNNSASDDTPIAVQCEPEQQTPSIVIQKTPDNQLVQEGQAAQFNIAVTNNGPVDLVNVVVSDQQAPDCNRNIGDLASGAIVVYNCSKPNVTQGFTNVATVTGETPDGGDVSDEDDAEVTVLSVDEPQAVVPIPTLSQWGLIFMAGLMLLFGASGIRFRKRSD